jgi:pimeloyl-ACP methyl ester carboxylesterase
MESGRRERLLDNDPEALIAATTAPMGTDGVETLLPGLNIPFMLYCGDYDGFFPASELASKAIPGAVFVPLPGLDHGQASRDMESVLPHISKFLKEATSKVAAGT